VRGGVNVVSCHTNLDSARGGLADIAAQALGLTEVRPLVFADTGWRKFVGFVPPEELEAVSRAVFAAGAGTVGDYTGCAYVAQGQGWFKPEAGSRPAVGRVAESERVPEVRLETVVPHGLLDSVVRAYVAAHPYEEPAFDVYPVEDRLPREGLGRVGHLERPLPVEQLALRAAEMFGLEPPLCGGRTGRDVSRVAVLPGSGHSVLVHAARVADAFVTGDLSYHDADQAEELGLALISLPHGELEWAAMKHWVERLRGEGGVGADIHLSHAWAPPWHRAGLNHETSSKAGAASSSDEDADAERRKVARASRKDGSVKGASGCLHLWIDGGSRGNPGPSAIGVVLKDEAGKTLEEVGRTIAPGTNNAAEYQALLEGLDLAARYGGAQVEVNSDSELLVKQMRGEYRVKNEGLREFYAEAKMRASGFARCSIRHVVREENVRADELVNAALDTAAGKKVGTKARGGSSGSAFPGLF
jgi:ribonuclease HI